MEQAVNLASPTFSLKPTGSAGPCWDASSSVDRQLVPDRHRALADPSPQRRAEAFAEVLLAGFLSSQEWLTSPCPRCR